VPLRHGSSAIAESLVNEGEVTNVNLGHFRQSTTAMHRVCKMYLQCQPSHLHCDEDLSHLKNFLTVSDNM